jgi:hypothetical protein
VVSSWQQSALQAAAVVEDEEQYKPVNTHFFFQPVLHVPAVHAALAVQQSEFLVADVVATPFLVVST